MQLDTFTRAYIEAALFAGLDEAGAPLNRHHTAESLAPETLQRCVADCAAFRAGLAGTAAGDAIEASERSAGHDFLLTRNNHGSGYWDGDWSGDVDNVLTAAAHAAGQIDFYVGDDGLIYYT